MSKQTFRVIAIVLIVLIGLAGAWVVYMARQGAASSPPAPTATAVPEPITGISWEWTGMQDSSGETSVRDPKSYTIAFYDDGTVAVQADCNQLSGSYSRSGSSLSIALGPSTAAYCGEDSQDQLYLASLNKVNSYAADNKGLELHFGGGSGKMDFRDGGPAR